MPARSTESLPTSWVSISSTVFAFRRRAVRKLRERPVLSDCRGMLPAVLYRRDD